MPSLQHRAVNRARTRAVRGTGVSVFSPIEVDFESSSVVDSDMEVDAESSGMVINYGDGVPAPISPLSLAATPRARTSREREATVGADVFMEEPRDPVRRVEDNHRLIHTQSVLRMFVGGLVRVATSLSRLRGRAPLPSGLAASATSTNPPLPSGASATSTNPPLPGLTVDAVPNRRPCHSRMKVPLNRRRGIEFMHCPPIDSADGEEDACSICYCILSEQPKPDCPCPSCNSDMTTLARVRKCGHDFHKICLMMWLRNRNTCPNCRTTVH